jgi:hypothetical protein
VRCGRSSWTSSFSGVDIACSYVAVDGARDRSGVSMFAPDASGADSPSSAASDGSVLAGGAASLVGGGDGGGFGEPPHATTASATIDVSEGEANLTLER